jgi:KamA family protein
MPQYGLLSDAQRFDLRVVGEVLPFRVNSYVTDHLIDWSRIPEDPLFRLSFMQKQMLPEHLFSRMADAVRRGAGREDRRRIAHEIRRQLNPHPAGQLTDNVPLLEGEPVEGIQHKYRETCLVFPRQGQTCHSYCTFCFRWPQFVGMKDHRFSTDREKTFLQYIQRHTEITDVLLTGGDPMVMSARNLTSYIEPLLAPAFDHVRSIRIGTKSISYWPNRYVIDCDSDDLIRLFERVVSAGKHLAIMAHFNHWRELVPPMVEKAIRRIRSTGAVIRTQSPLLRHINDRPEVWAKMWRTQVRLGCVPYYMFVERPTGAQEYFAVPLVRACSLFRQAYQRVSGLGRTVRGPTMSAHPGKVLVDGVVSLEQGKAFVLNLIQARNPELVGRPFLARFDKSARWLSDLQPLDPGASFPFTVNPPVAARCPSSGLDLHGTAPRAHRLLEGREVSGIRDGDGHAGD